jgi:hypothetical protein
MTLEWHDATRLVFQAVGAMLFGYVGYRISQRTVSGAARSAQRGFVVWWYGLAALNVLTIAFTLAGQATTLSTGALLTQLYLLIGLICVISYGLLSYLLYLYTGGRRIRLGLAVFYVVFFAFLVWLIQDMQPVAEIAEDGTSSLGYLNERPRGDPLLLAASLLLVGPLFAGGIAYGLLYFRVQGRSQKYRVAMVAGAFIFWFGSSITSTIVLNLAGIEDTPIWWTLTSQLIGLAAAIMVLMAFQPPAWLRQRFGVQPVHMEA